MTSADSDLEALLRRGLHAAAESIEPAPGGLDIIRQRVKSHRLRRQAGLLLADCLDLVRVLGIRLEPVTSRSRAGLPAWLAIPVRAVRGMLPAGRRGVAHSDRGRPAQHAMLAQGDDFPTTPLEVMPWADEAPRRPREGRHRPGRPPVSWLRPAMVVAGAVLIVVTGVYGLTQLRQTVTTIGLLTGGSPSSSPAAPSRSGPGHQSPSGGTNPAVAPHPSTSAPSSATHQPSPSPTCPSGASSAQPSPSPDPTPSPTPTLTPSPTPTASGSNSATPSDTTSTTTAVSISIRPTGASSRPASLTAACGTPTTSSSPGSSSSGSSASSSGSSSPATP